MPRILPFLVFVIIFSFLSVAPASAKKENKVNQDIIKASQCHHDDKDCLLTELESITDAIDNKNWRDQTYREIAKLLAHEKKTAAAISLLDKIEHPDTKALTIRGIGMSAAQTDMSDEEFIVLFTQLRAHAEKIEHPPSYAIALTYIAMAQAFSGDDIGALKTAMDMKNDALRNKALGESAEIQAERGDLEHALESISHIDSDAFRNKAYRLISKIFAQEKHYDKAINAANQIDNTYQRAQAVLFILAQQITPEEVSLVE